MVKVFIKSICEFAEMDEDEVLDGVFPKHRCTYIDDEGVSHTILLHIWDVMILDEMND